MKRIAFVLVILAITCAAAYATDLNPSMILLNVTPSAFDDCQLYVSPLDQYGRAGTAFAVLSRASIDSERRQDISMFSPVGWQPGGIYHRCHLVGAQLTSGTACAENLVTGTEYLNIEGMLPIENRVRTYVSRTGDHVLYKVTPVYQGTELLPRAVEITVYSIETNGLRMTAYCYNIQPGYDINYSTGAYGGEDGGDFILLDNGGLQDPSQRSAQTEPDYVLNVKSKKFHYPWCMGVSSMSEKNRQDFYGTRSEAIAQGYSPCGTCNP